MRDETPPSVCINCANQAGWSSFVVGERFSVEVKMVSFINDVCPSSPGLPLI